MSSLTSGVNLSRLVLLGEIRVRTAKRFDFLLEELVPFAELAKLSVLRTSHAGFLALFEAFQTKPFVERAEVDAEVLRDLSEYHPCAAVSPDPYDVVAELLG